jgi:hypothetical protein
MLLLGTREVTCEGVAAGGVGTEELMYPEYCRKLIDNAPEGFDEAIYEWEQLYKPVILPTALSSLPVSCTDCCRAGPY